MAERSPERQRELDARARQAGFKNYEELAAWMNARKRGGTVSGKPRPDVGSPPKAKPTSNALSAHPSTILDYVRRRFGEASKGE